MSSALWYARSTGIWWVSAAALADFSEEVATAVIEYFSDRGADLSGRTCARHAHAFGSAERPMMPSRMGAILGRVGGLPSGREGEKAR